MLELESHKVFWGSSAIESSPLFPIIPTDLYVTGVFDHLHQQLCSHHASVKVFGHWQI